MNQRTLRDHLHSLGPLVLRIGIAAVLIQSGVDRAAQLLPRHEQTPAAATSAEPADVLPAPAPAPVNAASDGVSFSAQWSSLLGIGELAAAAMLVIGLGTRLVALCMLGLAGYGAISGFPADALPQNTTAMAILAVVGVSLLLTGGGSLAIDNRRRHRNRAKPTGSGVDHSQVPTPRPNSGDRPPLAQRAKGWWTRRRAVPMSTPLETSPPSRLTFWRR